MKINDKVQLLESTKGAFVYLIDGPERILIDTGLPFVGKRLLRELRELHVEPARIRHILLTHYDVDHIGNVAMLQELTGATVWASAEEIPYIMGDKPRPGFKKHLVKIFRCRKPKGLSAYGETVCGGRVQVIPTPGHTPGHVCLLVGGILFAGDIVENDKGTLRPYPAGWNWDTETMLASVRSLSGYDFDWICTAHGRPMRREGNWQAMLNNMTANRT